jgi:V8-like Glu-specific endopeptidase
VNANETPTRAIGSARSSFSPTSPAAPNVLGGGLGSITAASPTPPTRNNPTQNFSTAGPSDQSAGFRGDGDESALETSNSFLQQIEQTSKRFAEAQSQEVSFEIADGDRTKARIKDADRLSWRLRQLGIPDEQIASTSQESFSFQPITNTQEHETSTADLLLERILGRNDMVAAPRFLEAGLRASRAVARIRIRSASGRTLGWGTGSLIAPRLLLTNNHVLKSASAASHSLAEFNVEEPLPGQTLPLVAFALRPDEFFLTDEFLDFTLVAVAPQSTNGQSIHDFGYNPPFEGDDPILESEKVNIIQHPSGRPKELALRDNTVTAILADFIHYEADTEPGSSGSPVFNDQWQLVALHHSGVPKRDGQGRIVMRDGRPWQKGLSDQLIDWVANEGVRLSRILAKVQAAPLTTSAAKALRDQLRPFNSSEAVATNPSQLVSASNQATDNHRSAPSSQSPPAATSVVTPSPMAVATTGPDGVLKIVVPVEITISLDASGIAPRANPPSDSLAQGASQTLRDPTS